MTGEDRGDEVGDVTGADRGDEVGDAHGEAGDAQGDSRAVLPVSADSGAGAATLPQTGAERGDVLLPGLALLALGMLLVIGARRVQMMR